MIARTSPTSVTLPESVISAVGPWGEALAAAAAAALAGGTATLRHYRADDLAVEEGGRGPVTAADRASHDAILGTLSALRPGEPVRSEEGGASTLADTGGRLWVVDPLDGTREFIARIDEFSVMVGLTQDGEAVLGAVYQPAADRLFLGVVDAAPPRGSGAWVIEGAAEGTQADWDATALRADAPSLAGPEPRLRMVESRSHPDERLRRLGERLANRFRCVTVRSGSAGTKCARVAAGEADLYVHPVPHLREWDTCAGEAVARGAGVRVSDCGGSPLRYGKVDPSHADGIFVALPAIWESVAADVAAVASPGGESNLHSMKRGTA